MQPWYLAIRLGLPLQALLFVLVTSQACANNGLNFIGSGLESFAMGGADIAVSRDPLALNTNPAGLAWQRTLAVEQEFAVARAINSGFSDQLNPDQTVTNKYAPIGEGGIAFPIETMPITLSHGLFVAGGTGSSFSNVVTPFGTTGELSAKFGIVKTSVGGGGQVTDKLSIGMGGSLYYARLDQKVFPGVSVVNPDDPARPLFFGTYLHGATGVSGGTIIGVQYRATDSLTLGAIYQSKVNLPLSTDHFIVNASAAGLGPVSYHSARVSGLAEPHEAGLGISSQVTERLLLALDIKWLDWAGALKASTINASQTDTSGATPTLSLTSDLNWRSQVVLAVGGAFEISPEAVIWLGYNYGRNPIPAASINPLMAAIGEHHLTGGLGTHLSQSLIVGASFECLLPTTAKSADVQFPLGRDLRVSTGYFAIHAGLKWIWQ